MHKKCVIFIEKKKCKNRPTLGAPHPDSVPPAAGGVAPDSNVNPHLEILATPLIGRSAARVRVASGGWGNCLALLLPPTKFYRVRF